MQEYNFFFEIAKRRILNMWDNIYKQGVLKGLKIFDKSEEFLNILF